MNTCEGCKKEHEEEKCPTCSTASPEATTEESAK